MSAARYLFRAELRRGGWRFVVATSVLLGLVGGLAVLAGAGARRTSSAFQRLERVTLTSTVLVNPEDPAAAPPDQLRKLPGVEAVSAAYGLIAIPFGRTDPFEDVAWLAGVDASWFRDVDVPVVRNGRLPVQSRPDELFANPAAATAIGLRVGDTIDVATISPDEIRPDMTEAQFAEAVRAGKLGKRAHLRIVGIGVTTGDVVPGAQLSTLLLTTAFLEKYGTRPAFSGYTVRLSGGTAATDAFIQQVKRNAPAGAVIDFQTLASDRATVHRAVLPQVVALLAFAAVLTAGAMLAIGQTLGRRAGLRADDDRTLAAMGMTPQERRAVDWFRLGAVVVGGIAIAFAVAALGSGLTPVGVARGVEPKPGLALDWVVLGPGALVLAFLVGGCSVVTTLRARRVAGAAERPSVLVGKLRSMVASPSVNVGVGMALEPGHGRTSVPTRSTLATAITGLVTVTASLTFAASLDHFVGTPRAYGFAFDAMVAMNDGPPDTLAANERKLPQVLDDELKVEGWSQLFNGQVKLASGIVPAYGIAFRKGAVAAPTVVRGRAPRGPTEVALGANTLRAEHVGVGDPLTVTDSAGAPVRFEVVGQVVLPGLTQYGASDQAALGVGALFTEDGLTSVTGAGKGSFNYTPTATLVSLRSGTTQHDLDVILRKRIGPNAFAVSASREPADVASYRKIRATPLALAGLLGLLAAVTVGHALVVAVRRRRIDLAILRTMGFTPGQVSRAVGWQATTVALIAAVVGIPFGLLLGRLAWSAVARQLGVVDTPVVPTAAFVAVPAAVLFANLVALAPGRRAARLRPVQILRAE